MYKLLVLNGYLMSGLQLILIILAIMVCIKYLRNK